MRFKSGIGRGGKTDNLFISDIVMSDIKDEAIIFQCDYVDNPAGGSKKQDTGKGSDNRVPEFQDIHIQNVVCRGCKTGIKATGIKDLNCVHDIYINNCTIVYDKVGQQIDEQTAILKCTNLKLVQNKK